MNREATAYHEAGHAIAAWRCRVRIKSVTIRPAAGEYHGRLLFRSIRTPQDMSERWAERHIVTALAGPLAQRKFAPRSTRGWHSQGDYQWACELALRAQGSGALATAWLQWLTTSTTALVETNWPHIKAVANALLQDEELDGQGVFLAITQRALR